MQHFPGVDIQEAIAQLQEEREFLTQVALTSKEPAIKDLCAELFFRLEMREKDLYETRPGGGRHQQQKEIV